MVRPITPRRAKATRITRSEIKERGAENEVVEVAAIAKEATIEMAIRTMKVVSSTDTSNTNNPSSKAIETLIVRLSTSTKRRNKRIAIANLAVPAGIIIMTKRVSKAARATGTIIRTTIVGETAEEVVVGATHESQRVKLKSRLHQHATTTTKSTVTAVPIVKEIIEITKMVVAAEATVLRSVNIKSKRTMMAVIVIVIIINRKTDHQNTITKRVANLMKMRTAIDKVVIRTKIKIEEVAAAANTLIKVNKTINKITQNMKIPPTENIKNSWRRPPKISP